MNGSTASPFLQLGDGYHDLPPGKMANVVTCLEMRAKPATRPTAATSLQIVREEALALARHRALFARIGAPYLWFSRARLSDAQLGAEIHDPDCEVYVVRTDDVPGDAGLLELDFRVPGECEIALFGVVDELIGTSAARALMNFALERAWSRKIARVWLHTCSLDHPKAVPFYVRSGFTAYKRQVEIHDDPRLAGWLPYDSAPDVPIIG